MIWFIRMILTVQGYQVFNTYKEYALENVLNNPENITEYNKNVNQLILIHINDIWLPLSNRYVIQFRFAWGKISKTS